MTADRRTQDKLPGAADPPVRAPRGATLSCHGWPQEAALRLLMNSRDHQLAEFSSELAIRGDAQQTALAWESLNAILAALRKLSSDETLFVKSGVPAGVFPSSASAPRLVLVSEPTTSMESPFGDLYSFCKNAAASWFHVGSQGVLQTAYEILAAAARQHFGGTLAGKLVLANGLGAVNGAQSLAATLHGAAFLGIEANPEQIKRRVKSGYCDVMVNDLDEALRILKNAVRRREAASVGLVGNGNNVIPELARRGIVPDLVLASADDAAEETRGMLELGTLGAVLLDGENSKEFEPLALFGEDHEPLTWIALSGDSADIARADRLLLDLFPSNVPSNERLQRWIALLQKHVRAQGLPARVVWLSRAERVRFAGAVNDLVARGEISAPVVFGRAFGRVGGRPFKSMAVKTSPAAPGLAAISKISAAPDDEHSMAQRSLTQKVLTNALLDAAAGASWAALELSGDVAPVARLISRAIVADGTADAAARVERVLGGDPGPSEGPLVA